MSGTEKTVDPKATSVQTTPDFSSYEAKVAAVVAIKAENLPANKVGLFAALAAAGLHTVVVIFDGCGDSGQIESVTGFTGDNVQAALPETSVHHRTVDFATKRVVVEDQSIGVVIDAMVFDLLAQTHSGWEDNEGADGEFTFNVAEQSITLEYNERYLESTFHQHVF